MSYVDHEEKNIAGGLSNNSVLSSLPTPVGRPQEGKKVNELLACKHPITRYSCKKITVLASRTAYL